MSELAEELGHSLTFPVKCKYCQEQVFLFASPNGGRAVFAALGPPWPKHECPQYIESRIIECLFAAQTCNDFTFPIPYETLRKTDPFPTFLSGIVVRCTSRQLLRAATQCWDIDIYDGRLLYRINVSDFFPIGSYIEGKVVNHYGEYGTYLKDAIGYLPPIDCDEEDSCAGGD